MHWFRMQTVLTAQNFGRCFARHQKANLQIHGQRDEEHQTLGEEMPMVGVAIVLSSRNELSQLYVVLTAFFEMFASLQAASRN